MCMCVCFREIKSTMAQVLYIIFLYSASSIETDNSEQIKLNKTTQFIQTACAYVGGAVVRECIYI